MSSQELKNRGCGCLAAIVFLIVMFMFASMIN